MNSPRLTKEEYGISLALCAKNRSEDKFLQVGAVIENAEGRIIATGYNGLPSGATLTNEVSSDRDARRPFMIHAEINALSLIKRGEGHKMYCTLQPCESCIKACLAHGIKEIVYVDDWENVSEATRQIMDKGWIVIRKFKE